MKLFLSWSGEVSQRIALELRTWLPLILPAVDPFITVTDVEKGTRWMSAISAELEQCEFGVVCLTRENISTQWIAFEAGALSKKAESHVATILFGVGAEELKPPLSFFQNTQFTREEIRRLISTINGSVPEAQRREEAHLDTLFEMLWPRLEEPVRLILESASKERPAPGPDLTAMVIELLALARSNAGLLSSPEKLFAPLLDSMETERRRREDIFGPRFGERGQQYLAAFRAAQMATSLQVPLGSPEDLFMTDLLKWVREQHKNGAKWEEVATEAVKRAREKDITIRQLTIAVDGTIYAATDIGNWANQATPSAKPEA